MAGHRDDVPMGRHLKQSTDGVLVESAELAAGKDHRVRLDRHVSYCLAKAVDRELAVLPVGAFDVKVAEVHHQSASSPDGVVTYGVGYTQCDNCVPK